MESVGLVVVVAVANILGATMALPQAMRLLRTRDTAGISALWVGFGATANVWWVGYGSAVGNVGVVPVAAFSALIYFLIAALLLQFGHDPRRLGELSKAMAAMTVLPLLALLGSGWPAVGVLLGLLYGLQLLPAVLSAYRSAEISGVSATTWLFAWVEALLFGLYGWAVGDAGLIVLAACGLAGASAILLRLVPGRMAVTPQRC